MRKVSFKEVEDIAEADKDLPEVDTLRIFRMNAKEWPFILGGGVASLVMGASMPVYAVLFGEVLGLLSEPASYTLNRSLSYYQKLMLLNKTTRENSITARENMRHPSPLECDHKLSNKGESGKI